jgi:hypothetical protein
MYASQSMANNVHPEHSLGVGMKSGGAQVIAPDALSIIKLPGKCLESETIA